MCVAALAVRQNLVLLAYEGGQTIIFAHIPPDACMVPLQPADKSDAVNHQRAEQAAKAADGDRDAIVQPGEAAGG